MARSMSDDRSRAGNVDLCALRGGAHRAREVRRVGSVLTRIAPRIHLPWILDRDAGHARGQPVDLQHAASIPHADCRRGRIACCEAPAHALGATTAELTITFVVALAEIDRVEIVPDAQRVRLGARNEMGSKPRVGSLGCGCKAAVAALVELEHAEFIVVVLGETQSVACRRAHRAECAPDLERRRGRGNLQRDAQIARIAVRVGCRVAETDHGENIIRSEQCIERIVRIAHA